MHPPFPMSIRQTYLPLSPSVMCVSVCEFPFMNIKKDEFIPRPVKKRCKTPFNKTKTPIQIWFSHFFCSFFLFGLKNLATPLLSLDGYNKVGIAAGRASRGHLRLEIPTIVGHDGEDGLFEDLVDAAHLLATALHVLGAHLLGHGETLLRRHGGEALGLEHVDAGLLVTEVGLEADEDKGSVGAEVKDFGVPL